MKKPFNSYSRQEIVTIVSGVALAALSFGQAKRMETADQAQAATEFRQASLGGDGRDYLSPDQNVIYRTTGTAQPVVTAYQDLKTGQTCTFNRESWSVAYWVGNPQLHKVQGTSRRIYSYPQQERTCR